jgi:hypothetical protein
VAAAAPEAEVVAAAVVARVARVRRVVQPQVEAQPAVRLHFRQLVEHRNWQVRLQQPDSAEVPARPVADAEVEEEADAVEPGRLRHLRTPAT